MRKNRQEKALLCEPRVKRLKIVVKVTAQAREFALSAVNS